MLFSVSKIKCEYPLPLSEEQMSYDAINWENQDFMTMSLGGYAYTIEEDGQIYEELLETHHDEETGEIIQRNEGIRKLEYVGEVRFNLLHMAEKEDLWVEFIAWVREGELKEIHLGEWHVTKNARRKKQESILKEQFTKALKTQKRWWWLPYRVYLWCVWCVYGLIKWVLIKALQTITFIYQKIS